MKTVEYFDQIINIPSPTGYTNKIKDYLVENAKKNNIKYETTKKGAVLYKFESKNNKKNVIIPVHMDTLGAMIKKVNNDSCMITNIGGFPIHYVIGENVTIHGYNKELTGTILPKNPSVHVNRDISKVKNFNDVYVRVDEKFSDEKKLNNFVRNGDFVSFNPRFEHTNGFVKSRFLDDKICASIMLELAESFTKNQLENINLTIFFNITEETGQGLAIENKFDEMLVVDMGCVGDDLEGDEYSVSICPKDSSGPYNKEMTDNLINICEQNKINYKLDIFPHYGSDGSGYLSSCKDIKVALIGPGVHASHGYERTHDEGIENTIKLIKKYLSN